MKCPGSNIQPIGILRFQDGTGPADQVTLTTSEMPLPDAGSQYQAWLIGDDGEQRVSLGIITFDAGGRGSLSFVDPQGQICLACIMDLRLLWNLIRMAIPFLRTQLLIDVILPTSGFMHVRHVLYEYNDNAEPNWLHPWIAHRYQSGQQHGAGNARGLPIQG